MKKSTRLFGVASLGLLLFNSSSPGADSITLQFNRSGADGQVRMHSQMMLPVSSMYPEYRIERSTNLVQWDAVGDPIAGGVGVSDELIRSAVPLAGERAFYRVIATVRETPPSQRAGDAVYGYATEFGRQLQWVGQMPLSEFVSTYSLTNPFLSQITFDPTAAEFWDEFNLDPALHNATNPADPRLTDFRLNTNEYAVFQTNGFVVSGRLGTYSFPDAFYKLFTDDLPVFFSADAALHAWHRSYMGMLEEVEETYLAPELEWIVDDMAAHVPALNAQATGTALQDGVRDADYFLAVAKSLITGTSASGSLGQSARVLATLTCISNLQPAEVPLFGSNRWVDFSQFQVRGHYQTSVPLQRYFKAMMWCGLIDFRFTGSTNDNSLREFSGAIALDLLLRNAGLFSYWQEMDEVIQMFVGLPDSMNFAQLNDLLNAAGITGPASFPTAAALRDLQARLMSGQLGVQDIQSGYFFSPFTRQQIKLPRSFTMLGQRFVPDAWAMNQCVFDRIVWDEDGIPDFYDKLWRRVPSALDVAFAVLGNNHAVPEIAARIAATNGHPWRDGFFYQHNLAAVRRVMELQNPAVWTNNIYHCWLACLRELSAPTTGPEYPDALRTQAWGMRTLNTQLASWTELRHDTLLYVKQPYTGNVLCSYPEGFIEPRVAFWERMREMALRTRDLIATLPAFGEFTFEPNDPADTAFTESVESLYASRVQHLNNFAAQMSTLRDISVKELNRQPLSSNEVFFIQSLIENPVGYSNARTFSGWYPGLFFSNARARHSVMYSTSDTWDALVADVHTDPTDTFMGDPGCILHEGVGNVNLLMVAVNWGEGDAAVYAGPVLSHYEFELGSTTRRTDSEWKLQLRNGPQPVPPDWTQGFLVPGVFPFPWWL